ncbi:hypothetical protein FHX81_6891 [Saccharothrix saharensis]|uniref:Uncharacterized protein n=1 Tax=Saccharothrix saharensis TaxID=571190 RepID=A0A543JNU3_9PSEU|nr:hypothetical protein [Saccharothrix saharensis]TQM84445.1 hypothetical protein FHX81_6891 [Saccharothrix saharensis]
MEFLIGLATGRIHSRVPAPAAAPRTGPPIPVEPEDVRQWPADPGTRSPKVTTG